MNFNLSFIHLHQQLQGLAGGGGGGGAAATNTIHDNKDSK